MKNKKGAAVWVSAVLYFGLGIILLTIILSAGLPTINKIRDKNIITQSKEIMHTADAAIREVIRQGPGAQRVLNLQLRKGQLSILDNEEKVSWTYNAKIAISEIDAPDPIAEGNLQLSTKTGVEKNTFNIEIQTEYLDLADLTFQSATPNIEGTSTISIKNEGLTEDANPKPSITIKEI